MQHLRLATPVGCVRDGLAVTASNGPCEDSPSRNAPPYIHFAPQQCPIIKDKTACRDSILMELAVGQATRTQIPHHAEITSKSEIVSIHTRAPHLRGSSGRYITRQGPLTSTV